MLMTMLMVMTMGSFFFPLAKWVHHLVRPPSLSRRTDVLPGRDRRARGSGVSSPSFSESHDQERVLLRHPLA